ncbi:MAG: nuclear transport factor 2 family protein [Bacteroidales bacterium]|nr:nuclear transport factor 2 family protein [Bacteroidales bacterium]MBK9356880.1 nuclear transport factor 2 family protein [Bacteroidales bacterium]
MKIKRLFAIALILVSCTRNQVAPDPEAVKQEVIAAEQAFAKMAADSGIAGAFRAFAAPDAVMRRGNSLVSGRDSVAAYISASYRAGETLEWAPDFVDVAASGDLAYTYGKYTFSSPDSTGMIKKQVGYFHTVWKRQPDGNWKFVWD